MFFNTFSSFQIVTKKYVRGDLNSGCLCRKHQIKLSTIHGIPLSLPTMVNLTRRGILHDAHLTNARGPLATKIKCFIGPSRMSCSCIHLGIAFAKDNSQNQQILWIDTWILRAKSILKYLLINNSLRKEILCLWK